MDHRYNPTFYDTVVKQARWVTRHKSCLYELAYKRPGSHECSVCKLRPVPGQVGLTLYVDNVTTPVTTKRNSRGTFLSYTCRCGTEQTCACPSSPINFPARLADEMATRQARSVADADLLVDAMTDDDATQYATVRDAFLRAETARQRTVERIRKASADEKTSQGGEVVYFVLSGDNRIKIGTSANVEKRLEALQTSSATKLSLLLTVPGGIDMETELHRRFKHIRESGEWFKGTPELRSFIEGALFYKSRSVM